MPAKGSNNIENKKAAEKKAFIRRYYGVPEFHYLKTCSHDVKRSGMCPFCKVIEKETQLWLKEEHEKRELQRHQGFYRRAEMRYGLLQEWAKNQLSVLKDVTPIHGAEIVLCSKLCDSVGYFEDIDKAFEDFALNLRKRVRVLEAGHFAAIVIQAIVRGHICRKKVRRYVLNRFQYYAENTRRKAYFLDQEKGSRWKQSPMLIRNERPVSPTTLARRLRSENKKCELHMATFERVCRRDETYLHENRGGLWSVLETDLLMLRQMTILRDTIHSVLHALSSLRREDGERPSKPQGSRPSQLVSTAASRSRLDLGSNEKEVEQHANSTEESQDSKTEEEKEVPKKRRNNRYRRGVSLASGGLGTSGSQANLDAEKKKSASFDYSRNLIETKQSSNAFPYWFSFSNPSPPARQIYLTLALQTPPLPQESFEELSQEELTAKKLAEEAAEVVITAESLEGKAPPKKQEKQDDPTEDEDKELDEKRKRPHELTLNERLCFLDKRMWDQMVCFDADDILRKISLSEDVHPALSSGNQIAEDSHRVWCGEVAAGGDIKGIKARGLKPPGAESDDEISIQYSATDSESDFNPNEEVIAQEQEVENEGLIIPLQLHIHPFYMHRKPSHIFRLFIINGKLRAVSHASHWAFHSDIWALRASMVKAVTKFAMSSQCKELVQRLTPSALSKQKSISRAPSLLRSGSLQRSDSMNNPPKKGKLFSVRLPDEKVIFDRSPDMKQAVLTTKEYKRIEETYSFLKRMHSWKKYKRSTKKHYDYESFQPERGGERNLLPQETVVINKPQQTVEKVARLPPPEELKGTKVYSLCCNQTPQSTLSERAMQYLVDYSGSSGYRSLLRRNINCGETSMEYCIAAPELNEYCDALSPELPPPPHNNMVILDVHLLDPRDEKEEGTDAPNPPTAPPGSSPKGEVKHRASRAPPRLPPMKGKKHDKKESLPVIPLEVEVHQVVGAYSSQAERAPAAVDTGLFTWSEINELGSLHAPANKEESNPSEEQTAFQAAALEKKKWSLPQWLPYKAKPRSGVFVYEASMTTAVTQQAAPDDERMVEFRMLGRRATREYIHDEVPLKVRKWLGLKY